MGNKRLFGRRKVMAGAAAATGLTIWSQRLSAQSGEVAVGAMVPITGPFNVSGQQYHFSLQMVQDEINAKGGVAGKKLKIVFEDVKDSNSVAVKRLPQGGARHRTAADLPVELHDAKPRHRARSHQGADFPACMPAAAMPCI